MNFIGETVLHKSFGNGRIKDVSNGYIIVLFGQEEKHFVFPDAFKQFLKTKNVALVKHVKEELVKKETELSAIQKSKSDYLRANGVEVRIIKPQVVKKKKQTQGNIAFKSNYCDGGGNADTIGFNGVCSDKMIQYNIKTKKRAWCSDPSCPCCQYWNESISREELEDICQGGGFVCHESQMLRNWRIFAGIVQSGVNKGKPMKLSKVQENTLAVLTTREPNMKEKDRFVFGVFLVDDSYQGDNKEEGYVTTNSKYKIKLSYSEAVKIKFWDFYFNPNCPEEPRMGHGLHRYLTDEQSAQILQAIALLKVGTPEEILASRFFEHFCTINGMDKDMLPKPFGALQR